MTTKKLLWRNIETSGLILGSEPDGDGKLQFAIDSAGGGQPILLISHSDVRGPGNFPGTIERYDAASYEDAREVAYQYWLRYRRAGAPADTDDRIGEMISELDGGR